MCCSFDGFDLLEWLCSNGNKKSPFLICRIEVFKNQVPKKIQEGKVEQEKQKATTDVSGSKASKRTKSLKKIQPLPNQIQLSKITRPF